MNAVVLDVPATEESFDEVGYLLANPDVAMAVKRGERKSGLAHFIDIGHRERRRMRKTADLAEHRKLKRERILGILRRNAPFAELDGGCIDFLTEDLKKQFNIVDTTNIASNVYDEDAKALIDKYRDGVILDCGAGRRGMYYGNVVNFEIVAYDTTDVRGVGEQLPFEDNVFDAVFSLAVLEHVKDPFQCAREIIRVLKPGGELLCCVPFLQPMHGYPNHYYNMTEQGIRNLFEAGIEISRHEVLPYSYPIWTLTWILRSWAEGLQGKVKDEFLRMRVSDLVGDAEGYLGRGFVQQLSREKNFELASGTTIFGVKKLRA